MGVHSAQDVALAVAYYTLCSSMMLVANKAVLSYLPLPGLMGCIQLTVASMCVIVAKQAKLLKADDIDMKHVKVFAPYAFLFVAGVFSNMLALQASNIETVIVFRTCAPLFVCQLDYLFLGRELPNWRSVLCLLCIVLGTAAYVSSDSESTMNGLGAYFWCFIYLACIVMSIAFGKKLIDGLEFEAPIWGLVLYTNVVSLPGMLLLACMSDEFQKLGDVDLDARGILWLAISCVVGLGISWAGWNCQEKVSATSFTLIGVACKLLTVLVNACLGFKHASLNGMLCLVVCIIVSTFYRQAPLRQDKLEQLAISRQNIPASFLRI
eukprot:TRINITY_DN15664_c0_g1_i1.p1 TRINITY_DN15664_c0_g1~~TRINITY_DN15664_c0_g1_i1.p1  ORF type:complete len:337 (+),score=39.07 TRINITY_DN15664_c0_g1_i1:44-1012(+)